jgi:DNA-directed RNA polymerase subunit M/transcription elongation factor TFIIS
MASTITITCPECDKQMKAPAEVLGKKIRCKGCGATFPARAPRGAGKQAARKPSKQASDDEDATPYGVTEEKFSARCPQCANALESEDAVICLRCGYNIVTRVQARTRKVRDVTGFDVFLWLLPGILCVLAVIGLLTFDILYCVLMNEETINREEWYGFVASLGIKIWIVVPTLFLMFLATKFAIKRLILDNKPPEIEENT